MQTTPQPAQPPAPKSNRWKLIAIVVVILIVVGVAAYILTQNTTQATPNILLQDDGTCSPSPPDTACHFSPASFNATVNGPAVIWKNSGTAPHTVTANATANGSLPSFGSSTLSAGNTYQFTFTAAGTYYYYCNIHLWMKGVIIVK